MTLYLGNNIIAGTSKGKLSEKQDILYQTKAQFVDEIILSNTSNLYSIEPTQNTSITFNTSNIDLTKIVTFELRVSLSSARTLTFPTNIKWLDDSAPDMSEAGLYYLVFRTDDGGLTWLANLQGKWSL